MARLAGVALDRAAPIGRFHSKSGLALQRQRRTLRELPMSRMGRDFSWHVFALVMVVAGLSLLAPLAWHQTQQSRTSSRRISQRFQRDIPPIDDEPLAQPQTAALRPTVADQLDLDP